MNVIARQMIEPNTGWGGIRQEGAADSSERPEHRRFRGF
jgi:hypothetical protein